MGHWRGRATDFAGDAARRCAFRDVIIARVSARPDRSGSAELCGRVDWLARSLRADCGTSAIGPGAFYGWAIVEAGDGDVPVVIMSSVVG